MVVAGAPVTTLPDQINQQSSISRSCNSSRMTTRATRRQHSGLSRSLTTSGESVPSFVPPESRVPSSSPRSLRQFLPCSCSSTSEHSYIPCLISTTAASPAPGPLPHRSNNPFVFDFHSPFSFFFPLENCFAYSFLFSSRLEGNIIKSPSGYLHSVSALGLPHGSNNFANRIIMVFRAQGCCAVICRFLYKCWSNSHQSKCFRVWDSQ